MKNDENERVDTQLEEIIKAKGNSPEELKKLEHMLRRWLAQVLKIQNRRDAAALSNRPSTIFPKREIRPPESLN